MLKLCRKVPENPEKEKLAGGQITRGSIEEIQQL